MTRPSMRENPYYRPEMKQTGEDYRAVSAAQASAVLRQQEVSDEQRRRARITVAAYAQGADDCRLLLDLLDLR